MQRKNVSSGAPWETLAGYCRAVRVGKRVEVAGTVASGNENASPYLQAKGILQIIENALGEVDATLNDVIRTRLYVTDASFADEVIKAHGEVFANIRPAATLLVVQALISDDYCVEIEASAQLS